MYESSRITVQPLILLAVFLVCHCVGCNGEDHSLVPVSIAKSPPYSYSGHIERVWGGDNFEVIDNGQLHYAYIRGIVAPKPGQTYYDESRALLRQLSLRSKTTVNVFDRDDWKREVCEVEIKDSETGEIIDPLTSCFARGSPGSTKAMDITQRSIAKQKPWPDQRRSASGLSRIPSHHGNSGSSSKDKCKRNLTDVAASIDRM